MPSRHEPSLDRYRTLHVLSLIAILGALVVAPLVVALNPWILDTNAARPDSTDAGLALAAISLSVVAVAVGSAMHVARAIVVREPLWEGRYRGPSVFVLLLLVVIAANAALISVANDVVAVMEGEAPSTFGSLVMLTTMQAMMLGVAGLFVAAPRALAGVRLVPTTGHLRSFVLGVLMAVPAWVGAQAIGLIVVQLLGLVGLRPEEGIAEAAIAVVDPVVLAVALVIVAPVAEEVFFRGVALNAWLREYGVRRAVGGSAAIFALIHGSVFAIPSIFALGIVLALLYRRTGSLAASIGMHAAFNGITLSLALLVRYDVIRLP